MISVLILTRNEEVNLQACLDRVKWSDDIVVFDSFSTDRTVEIAKANGARVIQRRFDDERSHRAASLAAGFKYPWVYNPDADELTTPELRDEMIRVVRESAERPEVAYRCRFKTMFFGKWIRFSSLYPTWVVRLFRPEKVTFERSINLRYVIDGPQGRLQGHFEHYTFNNGISAWIAKHNEYSWYEALESLKSREAAGPSWRKLFSRDSVDRRYALKELSARMPFRPLARFLYGYVLRLGFLDGAPGFRYCMLISIYEYMIILKMRELRRRAKGLMI